MGSLFVLLFLLGGACVGAGWVVPTAPSKCIRRSTRTYSASTLNLPRLSRSHLRELEDKKYVVIPNFLPINLQQSLRDDIQSLRASGHFNVARIGQDTTNTLNTDIRIAETCFIGREKFRDEPNESRDKLYDILETVRRDLAQEFSRPLDEKLTELLYVYYPQGGFYRRHRDSIKGSASVLRTFSLLLYLNQDWSENDGGQLRMHLDSGGDSLPNGEEANFFDVDPDGGTLVLFESDAIPHEVLDTQKQRVAVVGWYNRPVAITDIAELSDTGASPMRLALLGVAAALVTVGAVQLIL